MIDRLRATSETTASAEATAPVATPPSLPMPSVTSVTPPVPAAMPMENAGGAADAEPAQEPAPDAGGADAGACPSAIVPLNLYRFRSLASDECLAAGPAGFDGYDVVMKDCSSDSASWQLIASAVGSYEIRNVMVDYNVDIEFGNVAAGSNVVLFAAPGGPSQKFTFNELEDGTLEVLPSSASNLCLYGARNGVWLERCDDAETSQKWYIDPDECAP